MVPGAGTGMRPCAQRTSPLPTGIGVAHTASGSRASSRAEAPAMSAIASIAPTSWKWTDSAGRPCALPSAAASARKEASAQARARDVSGSAARMAITSAR
jgi:hypothetical protein